MSASIASYNADMVLPEEVKKKSNPSRFKEENVLHKWVCMQVGIAEVSIINYYLLSNTEGSLGKPCWHNPGEAPRLPLLTG